FAADALWQLGPEQGAQRLAAHFHNPAWKETLLLYSGLSKDAAPLLNRLVEVARKAEANPDLWLLAGQSMAEGAQQIPEAARRETVVAVVGLLREADGRLTTDDRARAAANLLDFGADLLPGQIEILLESDVEADWLLAEQLLPPEVETTLNDVISRRLAALTAADDAETQQAAVAALGRLGGSNKVTVEALLTGLKDDDALVRAEAAHACGRLGATNAQTVQALQQMYNDDPADEACHAALNALLALGQAETVGMVPVAAGAFLMGSAANEPGARKDEQPQHELYLPAYFIDRTPVTNAQFRRFIEDGGYANEAYWPEAIAAQRWQEGQYVDYYDDKKWNTPRYWEDKRWNGAEQPVVGVSWYEALAYAR
ncbi:MAG: SUMF1/EgtB/PvdO family nonheme iron enzyme, partial [Chloroflexi bacterium]|nr:SUMF1/EgtB/PvdO family nonheme iron enzyme [Chloroflexota bacterium]